MYARTYGAATMGVDGLLIDVEVDAANGLPGFEMVLNSGCICLGIL